MPGMPGHRRRPMRHVRRHRQMARAQPVRPVPMCVPRYIMLRPMLMVTGSSAGDAQLLAAAQNFVGYLRSDFMRHFCPACGVLSIMITLSILSSTGKLR